MSVRTATVSTRASSIVHRVCEALVHLHKGQPITDSLTIANEFRRAHKNVLQSLNALIADGTISRLDFKPRDLIG